MSNENSTADSSAAADGYAEKIRVWCNDGAGWSQREEVIDLDEDWGIHPEEWAEMDEDERRSYVNDWAHQRLEIGYGAA